jgi:hypothetical protein
LIGLLLAAAAYGGPRLICQRIEVGPAESLPWRNVEGWACQDPWYDLRRLTGDTLALLTNGVPVAVRMETMRRAALYSAREPRLAEEIALRLAARILDGDAAVPIAWFDAGYFVETVRQAAVIYKFDMLMAAEKSKWKLREGIVGLDGKKWVARARRMGGKGMDAAVARMGEKPIDPGR